QHYDVLTALNKAKTVAGDHEVQVKISNPPYDVSLPLIKPHPLYSNIIKECTYADFTEDQLPSYKSMKGTIARPLPCFDKEIFPQIRVEEVPGCSDGNSLEEVIKYLEGLSEEAILEANPPIGIPIIYEFDDQTCTVPGK
ncbi:Phosphoglycerate mutase 1, partial [Cricetulus griseus]